MWPEFADTVAWPPRRAARPSPAALSGVCVLLQAVISLMEMGFDEKEVIDALRVNNNQQNAAVSTTCPCAGRLPSPRQQDAPRTVCVSGSFLRRSVVGFPGEARGEMVRWYKMFYEFFVFLRKYVFCGRACDLFTKFVEPTTANQPAPGSPAAVPTGLPGHAAWGSVHFFTLLPVLWVGPASPLFSGRGLRSHSRLPELRCGDQCGSSFPMSEPLGLGPTLGAARGQLVLVGAREGLTGVALAFAVRVAAGRPEAIPGGAGQGHRPRQPSLPSHSG